MNAGASIHSGPRGRDVSSARCSSESFVRGVARAAVHALYDEVMAAPKPGLVSRMDSGSHGDMDASTFVRSLFSLRHYFAQVIRRGQEGASFRELQELGMIAERRMLEATQGVNTHRGAIFNLGLIAAAAGNLQARGKCVDTQSICETVRRLYGPGIMLSSLAAPPSHGRSMSVQHSIEGAREVAAGGFEILRKVAVPTLDRYLALGLPRSVAAVQTIFAVMSVLDDTNVFFRGGREGSDYVQRMSREFLEGGGVQAAHWRQHAMTIHRQFVERNLSPGGAADMLAAALFIHDLQGL
ncbi:triphosphoribosyl-dephospho-CoA synthase MdcB [Caballeronia sp. DA-9]|uniref:triphosphoribosyl-dephospho-CoA synthase MdcB n=1 Tax=Caballeronia sp. DA-9 TaxID=3436237 RepID=UPI003F67A21F